MNELKDAVLSTSAGTSPGAKGRRDHKKDSDSSAPFCTRVPVGNPAKAPCLSSPPPCTCENGPRLSLIRGRVLLPRRRHAEGYRHHHHRARAQHITQFGERIATALYRL